MNEDRDNLRPRDVDTRTATQQRRAELGEIDDSQMSMLEEEGGDTGLVRERDEMDVADDDMVTRGRNDLGAGE